MFLAEVETDFSRTKRSRIQDLVAGEEHFKRWIEHPASDILRHDALCCEEARLWFLSYARSMEIGVGTQYGLRAPYWLKDLFKWGPSKWPISWCQLVNEEVLDCGVLAALAREVFRAQGHEAHPAQALLHYNETCTQHWKDIWSDKEKDSTEIFPWIGTRLVYHELCVIELPDGQAKVYDSTWGNWIKANPSAGFGSYLALRTECPRLIQWGGKTLSCGEWMEL